MISSGGIDPCGSCDRTHPCTGVHILATLCRFDHKLSLGSKTGPFIPCERRMLNMEILEIQGRAFGAGFEIGSMTGLIELFRRHSGFHTNFRIYNPESRLIWS